MIVTVAGQSVQSIKVYVPQAGAWFADVVFLEAPDVSGRVEIDLGGTLLSGTVVDTGTRGVQRSARIVAGAGAWGTQLPPRAYHNDLRVKASLVAQDAAREAGEALGGFQPSDERVGLYYVRQAGPASRALERAAGGAPWWVDYDGVTHVGPRPSASVEPGVVEVVDVDPARGVVAFRAEDAGAVLPGAVISEGLDAPVTVRDLEIEIEEDRLVFRVWTAGGEASRGPVLDPLRRIVESVISSSLLGAYRYRVVRMAGDRVELQIVRGRTGLPNVLPVSMMPGVAGAHADLADGAEVLVQFVDGNPAQPVVTHFAGRDGVGWMPSALDLCGGTKGAARVDDSVDGGTVTATAPSGGGPVAFTYTPAGGGAPVSGTTLALTGGKITSGSSKVVIG